MTWLFIAISLLETLLFRYLGLSCTLVAYADDGLLKVSLSSSDKLESERDEALKSVKTWQI